MCMHYFTYYTENFVKQSFSQSLQIDVEKNDMINKEKESLILNFSLLRS